LGNINKYSSLLDASQANFRNWVSNGAIAIQPVS